jgi:hypothetical protein
MSESFEAVKDFWDYISHDDDNYEEEEGNDLPFGELVENAPEEARLAYEQYCKERPEAWARACNGGPSLSEFYDSAKDLWVKYFWDYIDWNAGLVENAPEKARLAHEQYYKRRTEQYERGIM